MAKWAKVGAVSDMKKLFPDIPPIPKGIKAIEFDY